MAKLTASGLKGAKANSNNKLAIRLAKSVGLSSLAETSKPFKLIALCNLVNETYGQIYTINYLYKPNIRRGDKNTANCLNKPALICFDSPDKCYKTSAIQWLASKPRFELIPTPRKQEIRNDELKWLESLQIKDGITLLLDRTFLSNIAYSRLFNRQIDEKFEWHKLELLYEKFKPNICYILPFQTSLDVGADGYSAEQYNRLTDIYKELYMEDIERHSGIASFNILDLQARQSVCYGTSRCK